MEERRSIVEQPQKSVSFGNVRVFFFNCKVITLDILLYRVTAKEKLHVLSRTRNLT